MFADETNITVTSNSLEIAETKLNPELSKIHPLLVCNKLALNVSKTEFVIIGSRQQLLKIRKNLNINIGGKNIKSTIQQTFRGTN